MKRNVYYVGLDIHKKIIAYCVKKSDGTIVDQGTIPATREALRKWQKSRHAGGCSQTGGISSGSGQKREKF